MKPIIFDNPHRKKHFDFFNGMNHPHFAISANVEITALLRYIKQEKLPTTPALVYVIARAANEIPEFRWRIRNHKVIEHSSVRPSFTVPTKASEVFSFCTVDYVTDATTFIQNAQTQIDKMQTEPSFEDEEHQDDYLFLSAIPWVSFTGVQHAMHYHPSDSVPRISWGKFFEQNGKTFMPLGVQVHHAVVNGRQVGDYYQSVEKIAANPYDFLI